MSANEEGPQNVESTESQDVSSGQNLAGGFAPSIGSVGGVKDSQLIKQLMSPVKASNTTPSGGSSEGEQVARLPDPKNLHSYTSPSTPVSSWANSWAETTAPPNPAPCPRRPPPPSSFEPQTKRIKVEDRPSDREDLKKLLLKWKKNKLDSVKENYNEHLAEMFFLENDGNIMDYQAWNKRPSREFLQYARQHKLEGDDSLELRFAHLNPHPLLSGSQLIKTENIQGNPSPQKSSNSSVSKGMTSPGKPSKGLVVSGGSSVKQKTSSNDSGSSASQQDQMVEKARQEAYVMQRIAALRKEGLWSEKRLAKVQEPPRPKAHWDYLLEEMVWLSADFAQERKWKKAAAKKCARMVQKYFQDKAVQAQKAEKEKEMRLRKIAPFAAKEIRTFWSNVEKLIEYKVNTQLDEKKKKALDQQLSFIVDQTEKYSSWLAESMNKPVDSAAVSTRSNTPSRESRMSDDEFEPAEASDDNEDTIAKEDDNPEEQESELKLLQKESEQTLEDLLNDLPPGYLESRDLDTSGDSVSEKEEGEEDTIKSEEEKDDNVSKCDTQEDENQTENSLSCSNSSSVVSKRNRDRSKSESESCPVTDDVSKDEVEEEEKVLGMDSGDTEFLADENDEDDEETILEQEEAEGAVDHDEELKDLQADNEIPIEELEKMYAEMAAAEMTTDETTEGIEESDEGSDDGKEESEEDMEIDEGSEVEEEEEEEEEEELASDEEEQQTDVGLETLMEENLGTAKGDSEKADKELQDATAVAESLQPKGFTLSSTCVTTPVPFLLKHKLREYQHVGLDWLTTMYEKKLNGILADEMGLGKTIQTISVLAHLACEKGNWGPHLIVVPTSVMLNWEMECKKWCPAFKILTYYGTQKERKQKRQGWTKPNAFHICITSYKLVIQDHQSFRRKKWKYFILDEAQNIKNFKSQRWQLLLNFQSQRRLLLTGTPLQNNLMELWSLMHFLMPNVFASHREFREWFSNPVTGMIEGNKEYNDNIIKRLHKVLRPFILRRLKTEVEQQMPKKFEHIVMCRLSKRQRFLYEEFMSRAKTKETLASGNFLSVINVLMQLRKVCNHPNLFEARPTISPLIMEGLTILVPSLVLALTHYDPFKHVDLFSLNLMLADLEMCLTAFAAHRIRKFQASRKLIEEIDSAPAPPPKCPAGKIKLHVRPSSQSVPRPAVTAPPQPPKQPVAGSTVRLASTQAPAGTPGLAAAAPQTGGIKFQLIQQGGTIKAVPVPVGTHGGVVMQQTPQGPRLLVPQRPTGVPAGTGEVGTGVGGSGLKLVQTSTGQLLLTTASLHKPSLQTTSQGVSGTAAAALLQRLRALQGSVITTGAGGRPVLRLPTSMLRPQPHVASSPEQAVNATVVAPPTGIPAVGPAQNVVPAAGITPATLPVSGAATLGVSASGQTQLGVPATNVRALSSIQTPMTTPLASPACSTPVSPSPRPPAVNTPPTQSPCKGSTRSETKDLEKQEEKRKEEEWKRSVFFLSELEERRKKRRREKLAFINKLNSRRCHACPIYGMDLVEAVSITNNLKMCAWGSGPWNGQGYIQCLHATSMHPSLYLEQTCSLHYSTPTPETILSNMKEIINNFVVCVPAVIAPPLQVRVHHPPPSLIGSELRREMVLKSVCAPKVAPLHCIINSSVTQFPDPRLIQYDCGKLQVLDRLLRQLKQGAHRVLIFTQMTKMLDVFEMFLNYHGHIYLRLDGTTRVDQRQVLMERFNQDKRIFVFILSTRSGGIGVNLTGADTVIFYDSDWNPTMDAQAQDRCHRIGQTRDVHIYRLISEKTVEENILKKANQKRMLGDLAIEGGNFTTAFFKKQTIQDLFDVDMSEHDANRRMSDVLSKGKVEEGVEGEGDKLKMGAFETALAAAEDETDVQAAKTAKAEAAAELAEFDENIPIEEGEGEEMSKAEQEVATLMKQLTPVERYAMMFLESADDGWAAEAERMEAEIEQQKKEWELGRLQALREEEERLAQNSEDDLLTFSSTDAHNQVWMSFDGKEEMPIWQPPTPPHDDNDVYIDHSLGFWYEYSIMPECSLPPVYIKREHKRLKLEPGVVGGSGETHGLRKTSKPRREDTVYAPRSLFDRPSPAIAKIRRDLKLQRSRGIIRPSIPMPGLKPAHLSKTTPEPENLPEWLIHEDWAILQAIRNVLELPVNLVVLSPGHTPNWDLVADLVNSIARCYRSPRHCRNRYESTILPREEGKLPPDASLKKICKKQKSGLVQKKTTRPVRTDQLFSQDGNSNFSALLNSRYESIKSISNKRTPTTKPMFINHNLKNPKHAQVLAESGIQYDAPLTPVQVAANRAERIQREKQKNQATQEIIQQQKLLQQHQLQQQQQSHQQTLAQQQQQIPQTQVVSNQLQQQLQQNQLQQQPAQQQTVQQQQQPQLQQQVQQQVQQQQSQSQQQQGTVVAGAAAGTVGKAVTSVVLSQGTGQLVTVTASVTASTTAVSSSSSIISTTPGTAAILGSVRPSGAPGSRTVTLQELQVRTAGSGAPATVVSVAGLTPAQLHTAKLATQASQHKGMTGVPVQARTFTQNQLQYLRQAQARKALALQQQGKVVAAPGDSGVKRVQIGGQPGGTQKVQVAVSGGVAGVTAIQVSQSGRTQLMKPGGVVAGTSGAVAAQGKTASRESEVAALFRKPQQQQLKAGQVQVQPAQLLANLQVQGGTSGTPVATLVKTVSAPTSLAVHTPTSVTLPVSAISVTLPQARVTTSGISTKATTTQQTVCSIPLTQQLIAKKGSLMGVKQVQLGSKNVGAGLSTVQIVQGTGQKQIPHVTMHQIQQVIKQVQPQTIQHITQGSNVSGTVMGKAAVCSSGAVLSTSGTSSQNLTSQTKLVPMSVASHQQQHIKQTIQVVSAGPTNFGGSSGIRVSAGDRSSPSTLALQSGTVKVPNLLSQVALQGQPVSVAVRTPAQSPVRIQTSALHNQQTTPATQQQQQQPQQPQQQQPQQQPQQQQQQQQQPQQQQNQDQQQQQ